MKQSVVLSKVNSSLSRVAPEQQQARVSPYTHHCASAFSKLNHWRSVL
jgi:hypothetical protein